MSSIPYTPVARRIATLLLGAALLAGARELRAQACQRTVVANVVALDQVFFWNRLGAFQPQGMIYALRRDVEDINTGVRGQEPDGTINPLTPGQVILREDRRPRPLTLRMNVGDCLEVNFENLLNPTPVDNQQPATRNASVRVVGLQLVNDINDDGSFVGRNPAGPDGIGSLVPPGGTRTYTLYAEREGTHMLYSAAAQTGGEGDGGSLPPGLFGAVNVEPEGSEWYRSQVTRVDLDLATVDTAATGQPVVDYDAVYPPGHTWEGLPILRMTRDVSGSLEIVHSDLTAIIAGPDRRFFGNDARTAEDCIASGVYPVNTILRNRCESFREFTIVFHDEIGAVQAFDEFEDPEFEHTLHCCREGFAINYGTGGIGAAILANRFRVGPMWNCNECKYEEFFLSSWTVADPAMVVDIPANADMNGDSIPDPGPKATKALYPDDPSNTYHSYITDHVKFRNIHVGPKEHHIFHLHAHQWVNTPDDDESTYLDSQAIGPGSEYTYETVYDGSGNRPKTPGDAIFHCHFYPHFAQGMWALWRNHETFEQGTPLDQDGRPVAGPVHLTRALPDGEIEAGTPTPAVVPIPTKAMAPMPTAAMPGYPFYIPGVAGHRAPHPPLDTEFDGGLPRHVVIDDGVVFDSTHHPLRVANGTLNSGGIDSFPELNRLDFSKLNVTMNALELPEFGTSLELNAMDFHGPQPNGGHATFTQPADTAAAPQMDTFLVNNLPAVAGAPYADPCVDLNPLTGVLERPADLVDRTYLAASFQLDVKFNKAAWHFPQWRMAALWDDVLDFMNGDKPPEPLFFRTNTDDCLTYKLANLIPNEYDLDDFQVQTPTDVIGQHIHLVKFDVTSSDGAANGFNYEDGSFAPEEVRERIEAINAFAGGFKTLEGDSVILEPEQHPFFAGELGLGTQTTVQRWFTDDVLNAAGEDRTLRTIFTHDHFGPSTHQQAGLYAGLVAEPEGSVWRHNETGDILGGEGFAETPVRFDGGPTSWQAIIETANPDSSFREFNFQVHDFGLAYFEDGGVDAQGNPVPDPENAINPPGRVEIGLPFLLARPPQCPGGQDPPCPEGVSADDPGTMLVNYRNEPIALRVRDPNTNTQAPQDNHQGDLAHAFATDVFRADPDFNVQPNFYPPLTFELLAGDPFTPLMRAMEGDRVQMRKLIGAHEEGHNFSVHGVKWLFEPSSPNSGFRNSQEGGISEHFEYVIPAIPGLTKGKFADFLYRFGASVDDLWNGTWGLLRAYKNNAKNLVMLPSNPDGEIKIDNNNEFSGVCPNTAPVRTFDVTAVLAQDALPGATLVYNPRAVNGGPLHDSTAILYVRTADLDANGSLQSGLPIEPLILRANAGDCIQLTLRNALPNFGTPMPDTAGFNTLPMIVDNFNANQVRPSRRVGLHPQLVEYNILDSDGANVGTNPVQTVDPGKTRIYQWYAGNLTVEPLDGFLGPPDHIQIATPVEFGAVSLMPADPIKHTNKGAVGSLVIESEGATWTEDPDQRAAALVCPNGEAPCAPSAEDAFREFVLVFQDDINLMCDGCGIGPGEPDAGPEANEDVVPNLGGEADDPEDSGQKAINYRTEPMWLRLGFDPDTPFGTTRTFDFSKAVSNAQIGEDPVTPIFTAEVGTPVWFRIVHPGGHQRNHAFLPHGHIFEELPFEEFSTRLGSNPLSEWKGAHTFGPTSHFNFQMINDAGGKFGVVGDYLFRDLTSFLFDGGTWGLFRVCQAGTGANTGNRECLPDQSGGGSP